MNTGARTWTLQKLLDERCVEVGNCFEWQGNLNSAGHPMMSYLGKPTLARRVAWCLARDLSLGDIKGARMWNTCANKVCINPACTRAGMYKAMAAALVKQGRYKSSLAKRVRCAQAKRAASTLTMDDVRTIRAELAAGTRRADLATRYKKSDSLIDRIAAGDVWRENVLPTSSIFSMGGA